MTGKSEIEVIIGGKVYYISGYESEEYLQKVASYINSKISDFEGEDAYKRLNSQYQNLLLLLNMADDYFKAKARSICLKKSLLRKTTIYAISSTNSYRHRLSLIMQRPKSYRKTI